MTITHSDANFSIGVGKGSAIYPFTGTRISVKVVALIASRSSKDDYNVSSARSLLCTFDRPYLVSTRDPGQRILD